MHGVLHGNTKSGGFFLFSMVMFLTVMIMNCLPCRRVTGRGDDDVLSASAVSLCGLREYLIDRCDGMV